MDWTLTVPATPAVDFVNEIDRIEAELRTDTLRAAREAADAAAETPEAEPGASADADDPRSGAAQIQNAVRAAKQVAPYLRVGGALPATLSADLVGTADQIRVTVKGAST